MVVLLLIHFSFYYIVSNSYHSSLEGECQNLCPSSEALSAVVVSSYLQPLCPSYGYSRTTTYTRTLPSIYSFDVLSPRSTRPPDRISVKSHNLVSWIQKSRFSTMSRTSRAVSCNASLFPTDSINSSADFATRDLSDFEIWSSRLTEQ
jgi:hypothetical protein